MKNRNPNKDRQAPLLSRFGRYLTRRRKDYELTIRGLAARAGMPHSTVYQIEHARQDPHLSELMLLAEAFDEPLVEFLVAFLYQAR